MKINKNQYFAFGDKFIADKNQTCSTELMLCQTEFKKCALICLNSGNRWRGAIEVKNPYHITPEEFMEIAGKENLERLEELTVVHIKQEPRIIRRIHGFVRQEFIEDGEGNWVLDKQEFCSTENPEFELVDIVTDAKPYHPINLGR